MNCKYGMKRPFDLGTAPTRTTIIGIDETNDKSISGFHDILLTTEPLSIEDIKDFELTPIDVDYQLLQIASKFFNVDTLEVRNSDSLDFHEVSIWGIKDALKAAFIAGQQTHIGN